MRRSTKEKRFGHETGCACSWLNGWQKISAHTGASRTVIYEWFAARIVNRCPIFKCNGLRVKLCAIDAWLESEPRRVDLRQYS